MSSFTWELFCVSLQLRPTPPHLTSAAAEGILAQACENESNNAKRMRMGLDPIPVGGSRVCIALLIVPHCVMQPCFIR